MQGFRNATDIWLSISTNSTHPMSKKTQSHFLVLSYHFEIPLTTCLFFLRTYFLFQMILGLLGLATIIFTLFRAFSFAYAGVCGAKKLHETLLDHIIYHARLFKPARYVEDDSKKGSQNVPQDLQGTLCSPTVFVQNSSILNVWLPFAETSSSRLLNRFSSDTAVIDDNFPFILNILLKQTFDLLGTTVTILLFEPILILIICPLGLLYRRIQLFYRNSARELRRLESVSRSPIYSQFSEAVQGLIVLNIFRKWSIVHAKTLQHLRRNLKTRYAQAAAQQWLQV